MIRPTDRCPCQEGPISKGLEARTKLLYDFDPDAVGASFKSLLSGYRGKK